ncbi:uncharacterized protein BXZ73DRAFT_78790 [Epithele typhae]|uniref:uncharacterized protein n=1 Tax=Epithele typhae TaxID=378194 RepID=UPI0020077E3D|nr:uncharacterized protein BXZ73DRAFT_78790 [Epithele typhae]KAH9926286.1 hypothetical protein BXZ73DRAFT_78790 [Epithele typhae]
MYGDIEDLVLSGKFFAPASASNSPVRSRSPSPGPAPWPTEDDDFEYDSDRERRATIEAHVASQQQGDSIGMGPGRTGVKGVIRDRAEAEHRAREQRGDGVRALDKAMEKASLGGKTWAEEEKERRAEQARLEVRAGGHVMGKQKAGRFGHLREVGVRSYVRAVEEEDRTVWVVVHIYDSARQSLDRCAIIDDTLTRLAINHPHTKFLRARAGAIGFASSTSTPGLAHASTFNLSRFPKRGLNVSSRSRIEEKDEFFDDDDEKGGEDDNDEVEEDDDNVDTDVLPTLLIYRGGELVHSWVRVDWEAKQGIEELLRRHDILTSARHRGGGSGKLTFLEGDDDFSDDGEELVFGNSDDE